MKNIVIKVSGMHCSGCENRIKNVLSDIEGVEEVKANYQDGVVTVNANESIDVSTLNEKIEDLGFEVEE